MNRTITHYQDCARELAAHYSEKLDSLAASLDSNWSVRDVPTRGLTWRTFHWKPVQLPAQGWKIHVSAVPIEAIELCERVIPILIRSGVSFKIPDSIESFLAINAAGVDGTQLGKIVTVYPCDDEQAVALAVELDSIWPESKGPIVVTDRALRAGGAVSLRFGVVQNGDVLVDSSGRRQSALRRPDGSLEVDVRHPDGSQPEWVPKLPIQTFPPPQGISKRWMSIDGRSYYPLSLLHASPKGEVLLGVEYANVKSVILKTARQGAGADLKGNDARDRLMNEYKVLCRLVETGCDVGPIPLGFSGGDAPILVMEYLGSRFLDRASKQDRLRALPLLAGALAVVHGEGYVHRDVKLGNAILTNDRVQLIDFELAAPIGQLDPPTGGTAGYIPPEGSGARADASADVFALGACVADTMLEMQPCFFPNDIGRLVGLLRLCGYREAARVIHLLSAPAPSDRPSASEAALLLRTKVPILEAETPHLLTDPMQGTHSEIDLKWARRTAVEAGLSTRSYRRPAAAGHHWQNFHLEPDFPCVGINLGAAGIMLGFATLDHATGLHLFDEDIGGGADWLAAGDPGRNARGLFAGNAGVAVALTLAAKRLGRHELIDIALYYLSTAAPPSDEHDLFAGNAGVVLSGCMIAEMLGERRPLEIVAPAARALLDSARTFEGTIGWSPSRNAGGQGAPFTGAAHGSAGIALALAQWGRMNGSAYAEAFAVETLHGLYSNARTSDGANLRMALSDEGRSVVSGNWCHGAGGYLWCILHAFKDDPEFSNEIDWAVDVLSKELPVGNPTYCHGLAGRLELWRMIGEIGRHRRASEAAQSRIAKALRLVHQRRGGGSFWSSEEPQIITPDLWVGFLGPATATALLTTTSTDPLLSGAWLKSCSEL